MTHFWVKLSSPKKHIEDLDAKVKHLGEKRVTWEAQCLHAKRFANNLAIEFKTLNQDLSQFTKERDEGIAGKAHTKMLLQQAKNEIYSKHVAGFKMVLKLR